MFSFPLLWLTVHVGRSDPKGAVDSGSGRNSDGGAAEASLHRTVEDCRHCWQPIAHHSRYRKEQGHILKKSRAMFVVACQIWKVVFH